MVAMKACADRTAALRKERDHGIHSEIMIALAQAEMHFKICQYYLLHQIEADAPFPVFFDDNGYRISIFTSFLFPIFTAVFPPKIAEDPGPPH